MMNEGELGEFYRRIGAALCHLHFLEDVLVTFLTMKIVHGLRCAGQTVTTGDAQTLLSDRRRQLTLGPLIDSCISKKIVRPKDQERIKDLKRERDWLVHRCIIESGDDMLVADTRNAVFSRITEIQEEAISLKNVAVEDFEGWAATHGVDVDAAQKQAEAQMRNLSDQP